MKTFSIKDIESITGIKAHTIRIWEQRYDLVRPKRTETNIRYYDNDDIKKFINIATLIDGGLKISEISKMSDLERHLYLKKMSGCKDGMCACSEWMVCDAMFKFDSDSFDNALGTCVKSNGFEYTMLNIIIPFLNKVVSMWQAGTIILANVEFIRHLVLKRLAVEIEKLPSVVNPSSKCLLFMLESEQNEIGLFFTEYILKQRSFQTLYIGASVSPDNVKQAISFYQPDKIFIASMFELKSYDHNVVLNSLLDIIPAECMVSIVYSHPHLDSEIEKKAKVFVNFNQMISFIDK